MSKLTITPFQAGEKIQPFLPDNSIFEELGEEGIRGMISDFYDLLVKSEIKHMFPEEEGEFKLAKQHAADFIIQRFGGPNYYQQRRGNPVLVKRHNPFTITPEGRLIWLKCYRQVIEKLPLTDKTRDEYWLFIDQFSTWMINSTDGANEYKGFKPA